MSDKYMWLHNGRHWRVRHAHGVVHGSAPAVNSRLTELISTCACGYQICSQRGPCAPKPVDVLPEGWRHTGLVLADEHYTHVSGAHVWSLAPARWGWRTDWKKAVSAFSDECPRTREEAMRAALAAAKPQACICADGGPLSYEGPRADCAVHGKPAEPVLRPGWRLGESHSGYPAYEFSPPGFYAIVFESRFRPGEWMTSAGLCCDTYFPTREAAMLDTERVYAELRS